MDSSLSIVMGGDGNLCIAGVWCTYTHDDNCPGGLGEQYAVMDTHGSAVHLQLC
jgi:hypothetical protein